MGTVSVKLNAPWPTTQGLRRPQEGVISVSETEARLIENAGVGKIVKPPKLSARAKAAAEAKAKEEAEAKAKEEADAKAKEEAEGKKGE